LFVADLGLGVESEAFVSASVASTALLIADGDTRGVDEEAKHKLGGVETGSLTVLVANKSCNK
jgi:hypothetical protein